MKRIVTIVFAALAVMSINAQIRIWENGRIAYEKDLSAIDSITFVRHTSVDPIDPEPGETRIEVSPKSMEIVMCDQKKLRVYISPTYDGHVITFRSENTDIAEVNANGIITAMTPGVVNIIAYVDGALSDTCVVTVLDPYDSFAWGGMGLFKIGDDPISQEYTVYTSDGGSYRVKNHIGTWYIWDDNIRFTSGIGFGGRGNFAIIQTPVAIIQEGTDRGKYIAYELKFNNSLRQDSIGVTKETYLGTANEWAQWLLDSTYYNDNIVVQAIHYFDWDDESDNIDYMGYIKNGWIGNYSDGFFYNMNIVWFNWDDSFDFLKITNETGSVDFVRPYQFGAHYERNHYLYPSESVSRRAPLRMYDLRNDAKTIQQLNKILSAQPCRIK